MTIISTDQRVKLQIAELIVANCDQARVIEELQTQVVALLAKAEPATVGPPPHE